MIGLQPRLVFAFYGIGGPFIDIEPGREAAMTLNQLQFCWYLYHVFDLGIGAELAWPWTLTTLPANIIADKTLQKTNCPSRIMAMVEEKAKDFPELFKPDSF